MWFSGDAPIEYRGISWSMGGDDGATTVPNFLRVLNPGIVGHSTSWHLPELPGNKPHKEDHLNCAQSLATIEDVYHYQIPYLVEKLKSDPDIDFENDWKVGLNCIECVFFNI
jgi:phospholipase B1, membrane-associated